MHNSKSALMVASDKYREIIHDCHSDAPMPAHQMVDREIKALYIE